LHGAGGSGGPSITHHRPAASSHYQTYDGRAPASKPTQVSKSSGKARKSSTKAGSVTMPTNVTQPNETFDIQ